MSARVPWLGLTRLLLALAAAFAVGGLAAGPAAAGAKAAPNTAPNTAPVAAPDGWRVAYGGAAGAPSAAVDRGSCIVVPYGSRVELFCEIKVLSTLWVDCRDVTVEVPNIPPGRWRVGGTCPQFLRYWLTA